MGIMYFPDEVPKGKKKNSWLRTAHDWLFEESVVRIWIIVFILMVLNFFLWFFL